MSVAVSETITCVDCGGVCHRLTQDPELGWEVGDIVAYRCSDCLDAWYLELEAEDITDDD
jgi:hypothetical protein